MLGKEAETEELFRRLKEHVETHDVDCNEDKLEEKKYGFLDLFKSWALAKMTLIIWFIWFVNTLVYYGLSLNTNSFVGDPFVNFSLMGLSEIPAYIVCLYLIRWYDHRRALLWTMLGAAVGCWLSIAISANYYLGIGGAMFGKFSISASYAILYVYAVQLFPTVIRTIGMGSSSIVGRVGAILAPFLNDLSTATSFTFTMSVVGFISAAAGLMVLLLQEQKNSDMPDRPEDVIEAENARRLSMASSRRSSVSRGFSINKWNFRKPKVKSFQSFKDFCQ